MGTVWVVDDVAQKKPEPDIYCWGRVAIETTRAGRRRCIVGTVVLGGNAVMGLCVFDVIVER